jgi:signal transduction histidine kinase
MKPNTRQGIESPARRLEILYIATLSAVALLSIVSQALILQELAWQEGALRPVTLSVRQRSLERPLSLAALEVQSAEGPAAQAERAASLRAAVARWKEEPAGPSRAGAARGTPGAATTEAEPSLREAEPHRRAAVRAAEALLAAVGGAGAEPRSAQIASLVREVIQDEEAYARSVGEAAVGTEQEMGARLARLRALEFRLLAMMLLVLLLEGLFVISPAVRKIEQIMAEMAQTQEGLKGYAARLERSNHELQDFASVASHDLQEPLRKVMAFSDRLKSKHGATLDDQGRDYLERVQNAARRMQTLINDLLTYARVTTKAQPFVATDLAAATREVVSDLEVRIEQVKGTVEVGELPTLEADPVQVRQLMQNLIGNALKYHKAEVPPVVRVHSKLLRQGDRPAATDTPRGDLCQISVEDNGIGFDEVYKDRIFTIFQRLHGRGEYEGTGVGLAVCRKIAERHGGSITARSTPGQGSTFLVTLPVRQPKEGNTDGSA